MFTITALLGQSNWSLTYKNGHDADKAYRSLTARSRSDLELEDDFGCKIHIAAEMPISAVQRGEVDKVFEGQAYMGLFQARAQGKLQAMVQRDPQMMFLGAATAANGLIKPQA